MSEKIIFKRISALDIRSYAKQRLSRVARKYYKCYLTFAADVFSIKDSALIYEKSTCHFSRIFFSV